MKNKTLFTAATLWSVSGALGQTTPGLQDIQFAPARGPYSVPFLPIEIWWGIALGTALGLAFIVWITRSHRRSALETQTRINPLNIALEAFRELKTRSGELDARAFSSEVSDIVRRYIEQACEIPAQEQTTEEFLVSIQSHPSFTEAVNEPLERFLGLCDMAKFAQQSMNFEERTKLLDEAESLVEKLFRFVVKKAQSPVIPQASNTLEGATNTP